MVTMLRSRELLGAQRDELFDLDGDNSRFDVPLKRVKKRRMIQQPLSDLAVEIINEAPTSKDLQFVFESPTYKGQPIHRKAMADALRGTKHEKNKDKSETPGLCELFGLKPFTPHDLRRTAATVTSVLTMHGSRSASITRPSSSPNRSFRPLLTRCTTTPSESRRSVLCWTAWRPSSGGLSKRRSSTAAILGSRPNIPNPFPLVESPSEKQSLLMRAYGRQTIGFPPSSGGDRPEPLADAMNYVISEIDVAVGGPVNLGSLDMRQRTSLEIIAYAAADRAATSALSFALFPRQVPQSCHRAACSSSAYRCSAIF
ncbi:hypothetical protein ACVWW4_002768 [Bradyrhizobium sp. LB7.1]